MFVSPPIKKLQKGSCTRCVLQISPIWPLCLPSNEILESVFEVQLARKQSLIKQETGLPLHLTLARSPDTWWEEETERLERRPKGNVTSFKWLSKGETKERYSPLHTDSMPASGNVTFVALFFSLGYLNLYECQCRWISDRYKDESKTGRRKWCLHRLVDDPGFLQQVLWDLRSNHRSAVSKLHLQVFPKAAGVVIDDGAGVPKGLHQTVDQQDFLLERPIVGLNKTAFQVRIDGKDASESCNCRLAQ